MSQLIEVRDLANTVVKSIKPPVQTNEIFYGGTACLILSSTTSVVLYDIQQQKTIGEINSPPVKYISWSNDGTLVALMSKHSRFSGSSLNHIRLTYPRKPSPSPTKTSLSTAWYMRPSVSSPALGTTPAFSSTRLSTISNTACPRGP